MDLMGFRNGMANGATSRKNENPTEQNISNLKIKEKKNSFLAALYSFIFQDSAGFIMAKPR